MKKDESDFIKSAEKPTHWMEKIVPKNQFQPRQHLSHVRPRLRTTAKRNVTLGLLAVTLMAGLGSPAFAGSPHHERHGGRQAQSNERSARAAGKRHGNKPKTLTQTFASESPLAIPPAGSTGDSGPADLYPSTIGVSGFTKARVADVNLTLRGLNHGFTRDVDVLLVAPGGSNAIVMSDVGGVGEFGKVTDLTITLDDEAAAPPPSAAGAALTSGSFQPGPILGEQNFPAPAPTPTANTALSTFDGIDPNGEWQLFVVDDGEGDTGVLSGGWTLEITATVPSKPKKHKH